jgi:glycosyltransferase involved in cell wall biosynthesis
MRIVIDAIPVKFGGFAVALEEMLVGWEWLQTGDQLHLVIAAGTDLEIPPSVHVHEVAVGRPEVLRRPAVQARALRRICRETAAEVLLGILPATAPVSVGVPKVIMVYDMRHELLPDQFTRLTRLSRRISYGIGYRQAASIICISQRTRADLLRLHPGLASKTTVVLWGADHVDDWPRTDPPPAEPYALAFGHFVNKGVGRVIEGWRILKQRGEARPLVLVGLSRDTLPAVRERIKAAGVDDLVTPSRWLDRDGFHERFASAGLIVFPSDFEGFGLPAVEALRLQIPLVISEDPALLEVTGGHAVVMRGTTAESLADAVSRGWKVTDGELAAARSWIESFTWTNMAAETREVLAQAISSVQL